MATVVHSSADILEHTDTVSTVPATEPAAEPIVVVPREKDATDTLTSHILLWSFVTAVILAIAGFAVVTVYLFRYLNHAFDSFNSATMDQLARMNSGAMQSIIVARAGLWKFILQSCGVIAGVAFGFLGFALFLLGAKGDMDASFDDSQHKVQLSRMAPGSFVLLIAVLLIGICCYQRVDVRLPTVTTESTPTNSGAAQTTNPDGPPIPDMDNLPPSDAPIASPTKSPAKPRAAKSSSSPNASPNPGPAPKPAK